MPRGFAAFLLALGVLAGGSAYANVNLPLHHWAYEAIERLSAMGMIERAMLGAKPYSRNQAAKYVAQALEHGGTDPLLYRLRQEFRSELAGLPPGAVRHGARLQTEVTAASIGGGQTVRFRENSGGEYYVDGVHNRTDARAWVEVNERASLTLQPEFISSTDRLYLREFSLKLSRFNIAVELGRSTLWWGHGHHGSLLLTDHAFPLDMIKLGSEEAFRLPWMLARLGEWQVESFLARLERARDFPRARLFGLRVSYVPAGWLELGLTRLTMFGGEGRNQSFPKAVLDAYADSPNQGGDLEVNEQAVLDFRATLPGVQLYGELGSEDKWSSPMPSRAAYLAGLYVPQLFPGDPTDLRIEYADSDFARRNSGIPRVWYNNGTYHSGMRHRGFALGHHMGTDAIDLFVRATRYLSHKLQLGTSFNRQERDRAQSVHETKREAAVDLTWWLTPRAQLTLGYAYQRLKNPGQITDLAPFVETFAAGVTADNHIVWTRLDVEL
jgi:Capsule assembly protein Wzi